MAATAGTEDTTRSITLPDGRLLSYAVYGDPQATTATFFYCHSILDCHLSAKILDAPARQRGIRIVAPDRPGTGRSTYQKRRRILDWPDDLLCLADAPDIGADTFAVISFGKGSPYALACCAKMDTSRLQAAYIVSGVYPFDLRLQAEKDSSLKTFRWLVTWVPALARHVYRSQYRAPARDTEHPERFREVYDAGRKAYLQSQADKSGEQPPDAEASTSKEKEEDDPEKGQVEPHSHYRDIALAAARVAADSDFTAVVDELVLEVQDWGFRLQDIHMHEGTLVLRQNRATDLPVQPALDAHELLPGSELLVDEHKVNTDEAALAIMEDMMDTMLDRMGCPLIKI